MAAPHEASDDAPLTPEEIADIGKIDSALKKIQDGLDARWRDEKAEKVTALEQLLYAEISDIRMILLFNLSVDPVMVRKTVIRFEDLLKSPGVPERHKSVLEEAQKQKGTPQPLTSDLETV